MPTYPSGWEPASGGLLGFFSQMISEGLSQNKAIAAFREAGGKYSNEVLRASYQFAGSVAASVAEGWSFEPGRVIPPALHVEWPSFGPESYGYPVDLQLRDWETGEFDLVSTMVKSSWPLSPEDAMEAAIDQYASGQEGPTETAKQGAITGGVFRSQPFVFGGLSR